MASQVATGAGKAIAYDTGAGGSLRMANQDGQGFRARHERGRSLALRRRVKAFSYGTGAGGGSHLDDQEASGAGKAFAYGTGAGGRSHLAKLRDGARHCNNELSLSFLLRILSGAAKAPWRPASEKIRSKNERLSAQSFTRRYEMADHSEQANQTPSQGGRARGVRVAFFFCLRRGSIKI